MSSYAAGRGTSEIECARKFFAEINAGSTRPVKYDVVDSFGRLLGVSAEPKDEGKPDTIPFHFLR